MMVERPETELTTFRTGHMGCTFRFFCGGMCGCRGWSEFGGGTTPAPCGPCHDHDMCAGISAYRARPAASAWSRQSLDNPYGTPVSPMSLGSGPNRGFGICWRATADDDEHHVYATPL